MRSDCGAEKKDINHVFFRCKKYDEESFYLERQNKKRKKDVDKMISNRDQEKI